MKTDMHAVAHSLLWAAAILASALLHAPAFLTLTLLPMLFVVSRLISRRSEHGVSCMGSAGPRPRL